MDTLVITGVRFNPPPGCVYEVLSDPWMLLKDNKNLFLSGKRPKSNCLGNSIFWLLPALVYLDLFECNSFENILFEESRQEILQSRIDMVSARHIAWENGLLSWDNVEQLKFRVCDKRASAIYKAVQRYSQGPDIDSLCNRWPRRVYCRVDGQTSNRGAKRVCPWYRRDYKRRL